MLGASRIIVFILLSTKVRHALSSENSTPRPSGHWSIWGSWSACSKSCGNGTTTRSRDCYTSVTDRLVDPGNCDDEQEETANCNEMKCPGNILMIVGGKKNGEINTNKVYVMSLDPDVSIPSCMDWPPPTFYPRHCDFPHSLRAATTAIFEDGLPTVCGGYNDDGIHDLHFKECFKFNFTDGGWHYLGMTNLFSSSAGYSDYGNGGVIKLGSYYAGSIDTIEYSTDGATWEVIPTVIPGDRYGACLVPMDKESVWIAGGSSSCPTRPLNTVYKFHRKTGWEKLPDMPRGGRRHFMCGLVTDNSGNRKIVIAGGVSEPNYDWNNNHEFTAVDSFNLQTMTWQEEEDFPFTPIGASTNIPYGNTFITIGGLLKEQDVNRNVDFIYKYEPNTSTWQRLPLSLPVGLREPAAFILDENEITCVPKHFHHLHLPMVPINDTEINLPINNTETNLPINKSEINLPINGSEINRNFPMNNTETNLLTNTTEINELP